MEGCLSSGSPDGSRIGRISPGSIKQGFALFYQTGWRMQNLVRIPQELHPAPILPLLPPQPVGLALLSGSSDGGSGCEFLQSANERSQFLTFSVTQMCSCLVPLPISSTEQHNTLYSPLPLLLVSHFRSIWLNPTWRGSRY